MDPALNRPIFVHLLDAQNINKHLYEMFDLNILVKYSTHLL